MGRRDEIDRFFASEWEGYRKLCPDAQRVHELLSARGERIENDHVAYRTFDLPGLSRRELGRRFEAWGWRRSGETLRFEKKKLLADYWLPPEPGLPRVFISDLILTGCSPELQSWVRGFAQGTAWAPVSFEDYRRFHAESEYAAWTAAFGIQVNHFTVHVNSLRTFSGLAELNATLIAAGFTLNTSGGAIKGTPAEGLEQSSTMARPVPCRFAEGVREVPGCYYEFARRHRLPGTGELFQGFVPESADRIFESTRG